MNRQETGHKGEAAAAKVYLNRGYSLLAHNYKTRMGELDLVLQKGNVVVICEVKTRTRPLGTLPCEAVGTAKQRRIILAAKAFLQSFGLLEACIRFDVAEVYHTQEHQFQVHIIEDAFICN